VTSPFPSPSAAALGPAREPEHLEPPFPAALVEELLRLVVKAARAHQLYLPNNPIYHGAIDALRAGFAAVWTHDDELVLSMQETDVRWYDVVVAGDGSKSSDSLAWLFYKDGVRELKLAKGFEEAEVVKLLEIIQRARKGSPDEDDLVTMLWEADFSLLTYKYVDILQEGGGGGGGDLADGSDVAAAPTGEVQRAAQEAVEESRAGGIVNMADFDATLYFLDGKEVEYLQDEIAREYQQDLRTNVVAMLFDIFEQQADGEIRGEVLEDLKTLMVFMLTAGHFHGVTNVLREAQVALGRSTDLTEDQRALLVQLPDRLSGGDALTQLLQALDEAPSLPPQAELTELFDQLRATALGTVFLWLAKIHNDRLRPLLEAAAGRLASANTIRRAGALKTQAAVLALSRILNEPDAPRRQITVQALTEIASPGALQALERAVEDDDRDVRITAVRALSARAYRPVLARLESAVKGKSIREADLTEKMAFFEAYGSLCGDAGIAQLDAFLNGKGFLGRREDSEIRACAAVALGRINTSKAIDALRKGSAEKDIVVRNAVNRALRGPSALGSGGST
jgi:hypothetical protein